MAPKKKMTPSQRKRVFDSLFKTNAMTVMEIVEKTELPTQQVEEALRKGVDDGKILKFEVYLKKSKTVPKSQQIRRAAKALSAKKNKKKQARA